MTCGLKSSEKWSSQVDCSYQEIKRRKRRAPPPPKKKKKNSGFHGIQTCACQILVGCMQPYISVKPNVCLSLCKLMHYIYYLFLFSYRLFGLVGIIYTDCSAPLALHVRPYLDWPQCASPGVILALYWLLATETRYYFIHVSNIVLVCEMSF